MGKNLKALYNASNSSTCCSGKSWGWGLEGRWFKPFCTRTQHLYGTLDWLDMEIHKLVFLFSCYEVQASFSMTKTTLKLFAVKFFRYLLLHMENTVACSVNALMCLIHSHFWTFSVLPAPLRLNLRESGPDLMCLAVPSNKSSFLQSLLGVLLNSDLET